MNNNSEDKASMKNDHLSIDESIRMANKVFEDVMRTNGVEEALATIEPNCERSVYHSYVRSLFNVLIALITMEKDDVQNANKSIENMVKITNKYRRTGIMTSLMKMIKTPDYNKYTDVELHSDLLHSFGYALSAFTLAIETHNVFALIKVVYRLHKFRNNFRHANKVRKMRTHWESEASKQQYEAAVRLANGFMNLIISNIPPKILQVINFIGISGSESIGWYNIDTAAYKLPGLFSELARLGRVFYWSYIEPHLCLGPLNVDNCQKLLDIQLEKYPKNLMLNIYNTKLLQLNGRIGPAIDAYQNLLTDRHLTPKRVMYFELMWCYALVGDIDRAIEYAELFRTGSMYSPAMATFIEAVFRYVKYVETNDLVEKQRATQLFEIVPTVRIRHVGKTITPEKLAVVRSEKYLKCNHMLVLPDVEVLYELNLLRFIRGDKLLLSKFMDRINKELMKYQSDLTGSDYLDNYLMAKYLEGVVSKLLFDYTKAKQCMDVIIANDGRIGREFSLPAQAALEMGLIEYEMKNHEKAVELLTKCINEYTGYLNENYVHLRAFAALRELGVGVEKHSEDDNKLEEYKNQWLNSMNIKKKTYDQLMETEEKEIIVNN